MNQNKLISAFINLRTAKAEAKKTYDNRAKELDALMADISAEILMTCDNLGVTQIKGNAGTAFRQVKTRYWAPDWDAFKEFAKQHDALDLFEKRIAQGNYKQFLEENPDVEPPVNTDSKYVITIRRSTKK